MYNAQLHLWRYKIIKFFSRAFLAAYLLVFGFNYITTHNLPRESTFLIQTLDGKGNGSGVLVAESTLLTAKHLAEASKHKNLYVIDKQGRRFLLSVVSEDQNSDLALMKAQELNGSLVPVGSNPNLDDEVAAVGYPINYAVKKQVLTTGTVQGLVEDTRLISTAEIAPGNSGGGLFKMDWLGRFKLVGINVSVPVLPVGFDFGIPITYISNSVPAEVIKLFLRNTIGY